MLEMSKLENELFKACSAGDVKAVSQIVAGGVNVNARSAKGVTPLHMAATQNHEAVVAQLIAAKANVNAAKANGMTPLHAAVAGGHEAVMAQLIVAKADVNAVVNVAGVGEKTALLLAAELGNTEITKRLLAAGAEVNPVAANSMTPLLAAVILGHEAVVAQLIESKADVNAVDADGDTPLHLAAIRGYLVVARQLIDAKAEVNPKNTQGKTPIELADENDHEHIVILLKQRGAKMRGRALNTAQSTHKVSVHKTVSDSISALKEHYKLASLEETKLKFDEARQSLITWASNLTDDDKTTAAKSCVTILSEIQFTDPASGVSTQECLSLVWLAVNDPNLALSIDDRRSALMQRLYDIRTEYGKDLEGDDIPSCESGS